MDFSPRINLILGGNGRGKTNILESIYFLATGRSFKAYKLREVISSGEKVSIVEGVVGTEGGVEVDLGVTISGVSTRLRVDGAYKLRRDYMGMLGCVIFRPEDMGLISDGPDVRRRFLDHLIISGSWNYARSVLVYEKALRQRNKLLGSIRDGKNKVEVLAFWDELLIKHGKLIQEGRTVAIQEINMYLTQDIHLEKTRLVYQPNLIDNDRLYKHREVEILLGHTLVGPHKDDFLVLGKDINLATFGSRGEQRMAVLAIKLAEIDHIERALGRKCLLMLDDIFSELDASHRSEVIMLMKDRQLIVTSAEELVVDNFLPERIIKV